VTLVLIIAIGTLAVLGMMVFAFAGPSPERAKARRLKDVTHRHSASATAIETQMRRITANRATRMDLAAARFLPNPALLQKRLAMTGKGWTVGQYGLATLSMIAVLTLLLMTRGLPVTLSVLIGVIVGAGLPHMVVSFFIKRRIVQFNAKFPDAIELLVRGLRSGLPIGETMAVVGSEVDGPVGVEFRAITDKMKIGRTMDVALQETADRLGTPDFQFFVISIAIQRETGGNLAETLANLATVLRSRTQMKLKIKAMSSESKASAYIVGSLPFIVFGMVWMVNPGYMANFFVDQRLIIAAQPVADALREAGIAAACQAGDQHVHRDFPLALEQEARRAGARFEHLDQAVAFLLAHCVEIGDGVLERWPEALAERVAALRLPGGECPDRRFVLEAVLVRLLVQAVIVHRVTPSSSRRRLQPSPELHRSCSCLPRSTAPGRQCAASCRRSWTSHRLRPSADRLPTPPVAP